MSLKSVVAKACTSVAVGLGTAAQAGFVQFDLSSDYNRDIVFSEIVGDTAESADDGVNALVTLAVATSSGDPDPAGLPSTGSIPFGSNFVQLGPYDGDNAVRFTRDGGFAVAAPTVGLYDELTLHGFGTNGTTDLDVTLNYTDGDVTVRVDAFNWFRTPAVATFLLRDMDGFNVGNDLVFDEDGIAIFAIDVPLNSARTLTGFSVVQVNQGSNRTFHTNILAATGNLVPEPVLGAGFLVGALVVGRRRGSGISVA